MDEVVGDFEWDVEKRRRALQERGMDFADVLRIDPASVRTEADDRWDYGEVRYISTGMLDGRLVVVCWTHRQERIRIISLRKANGREQRRYEAESAGDDGRSSPRRNS